VDPEYRCDRDISTYRCCAAEFDTQIEIGIKKDGV